MKKLKFIVAFCFGVFTTTTLHAEQVVTLTTSKAVGEKITIMVNPKGTMYVDWGDGEFVEYVGTSDAFRTIQGEVKGENIVIKGSDKHWYMLNCSGQQITKISTKDAPYLRSLYCHNNAIKTIVKNYTPNLTDLDLSNNEISSFTISHATQPLMEYINIANNTIRTNVGITGQFTYNGNALQRINISNNKFTKVSLTNVPNLDALNCANNNIRTLDFGNTPNLTTLDCSQNAINSITGLEDSCQLRTMIASNNQLESLNLSGCINLATLNVNNNKLNDITHANVQLHTFEAADNNLTFGSLPVKKYKPENLNIIPQATLIVTGGMKKTAENVPYMDICPSYSDRNNAEYILDVSDFKEAPGHASQGTTIKAYTIDEDGNLQELTKATSSAPNNDYSYSNGKLVFYKEQKQVVVVFTNTAYPELTLQSDIFCVGENIATSVENVSSTTDELNIATERGIVIFNANQRTLVKIYNLSGQKVWGGVVVGNKSVSLPSGTYIINGQKYSI